MHKENLENQLWSIGVKIRGLGQTISMSTGDPPFSEEGLKGLGYFLIELADNLDAVRESIEI